MRYPQAVATRSSLSIRFSRFGRGAFVLVAAAGWLAADQILQTYSPSLTTYLAGKTKVQDARPLVQQRGVNLDGSLRRASTHPLSVAGNPFERVWNGEAELNSVRLDTGTWSPTEVDISLPATVPWVIGRSFNSRQDNSGHYNADCYQGFNWFQTSQPEIVFYNDNDDTKDLVYLVYGADRYVEFQRSGETAETFKSKNGAAGVFKRVAGSPDTWEYYAPDGIVATFLGFNTSGNTHDGQIWKIENANDDRAYVGSTTLGSVISSGYETDGRIKLAYDSTGRVFTYGYSSSTIGGKKRLESVTVTHSSIEIARVEYGYYPDSPSPSYGDPGDLRTVTTTLPLSESGVNDIRVQYYRYYEGSYDDSPSSPNRGYPHALLLQLDHEGARKQDWLDTTFDSDFLTETTANLKEYASVYLEYDTNRRIDVAWFNGKCGCGSGGAGTFGLSYGTNGSYSDGSGYDTTWCRRTIVDQPDSGWVTQYFDEIGQPLSRIMSDGNPSGSPTFWPTRAQRDSMGCVDEIGTPASVTTYTHSTGAFTNASTGLVRAYDRVSSGDATGFLEHERWRSGTSGSEYFLRSHVWWTDKATKTLSSLVLTRPLVKETWEYSIADTDDYAAAANKRAYDYWMYASLPLTTEKMEETFPIVSTGNNGSGTSHTLTVHYQKDGLVDYQCENDGTQRIIGYRRYEEKTPLLAELRSDADTSDLSPPSGFAEENKPLNHTQYFEYDLQARLISTITAGNRQTRTHYTRLADRRSLAVTFPHFVPQETMPVDSGEYYGPASFQASNQSCGIEADGLIELAESSIELEDLAAFVDESYSDPVQAIDGGDVSKLSTASYDKSSSQRQSEQAYFVIPSSLPGTDGTHYDETTYKYDELGRRVRAKAPHGTINRTVYDVRGQPIEHWIGTNDADEGGTDNIVKTDATTFDINGYVTARTAFIQDSATGQRVTSFSNDLFGRPLLTTGATAPHTFVKYDNLGRQVASAQFSSTANIVVASDDPTTETSNRLALSQTSYDERGRVWRTKRHKIDASDGSDDDNLEALTWYDKLGRIAKRDGEQLEKWKYDRLDRATHHFILAAVDSAEDVYAEMLDVASDIVLEEWQTTFDVDGNVLMEATISRLYNDTGSTPTTGALDTNVDDDPPDPLKYTTADVLGRIQITAKWYDILDRLEDVVHYGTNHATDNAYDFNRDGLSVPARSDTALRTTYTYDYDGTVQQTTDPKGLITRYEYDALGRTTKTIANYGDGVVGDDGGDDDQTVLYAYTDGLQVSLTADLPSPESDQTTTYTFGTTKGSSGPDSKIATGHLLRKVQYPDSSDATNDIVAYAYNAQSQETWMRDQATTGNNSDYNIIETDYDDSGRQTARRVTQKRTAADGAVRRIATAYDSLGRSDTVTQYDAATSGNVIDQVKNVYDGWGNLINFRQDKDSTVGGSGYWEVAYALEKATAGRNTLRRTEITIPGGATYKYYYRSGTSSHDSNSSRVSILRDASDTDLSSYQYNGVEQVVRTYYDEPTLFSKVYTGAGTFGRLDRFDRTTITSWTKDLATDREIYKVTLGYDRNSNITVQDDAVHTGHDVAYTNDNLNRLTRAQEGTWGGSSITTQFRDQQWGLNHTGNWETDKVNLNGDGDFTDTGELDDDRTHNAVNELTARDTDDSGVDNYTFAYDAAGNMTDDGEAYKYEWDAFYRLRKVKTQGNALVSEYWYNGLGYLITRHQDTDTDLDVDGSDKKYHTAYDERWRPVATFRESDSDPKEQFLYHAAGAGGFGGSSYIDLVVMRDRDANTAWTTASDGALEERVYYCQNSHADVVAIVEYLGEGEVAIAEWVKYSAYGIPFGMPMGDTDSDGDCDVTDETQVEALLTSGPYDVRADADLSGDITYGDVAAVHAAYQSSGRGVLTASSAGNRKGYAGYEFDARIGTKYQVRHRVLSATLGRWLSRDPIGYNDGLHLMLYVQCRPLAFLDSLGLTVSGGGRFNDALYAWCKHLCALQRDLDKKRFLKGAMDYIQNQMDKNGGIIPREQHVFITNELSKAYDKIDSDYQDCLKKCKDEFDPPPPPPPLVPVPVHSNSWIRELTDRMYEANQAIRDEIVMAPRYLLKGVETVWDWLGDASNCPPPPVPLPVPIPPLVPAF